MARSQPARQFLTKHRQWGSGTTLLDDLPPIPRSLYHGGRLARWAGRRPRRVGLTLAWLVAVWASDSLVVGTAVFVLVLATGLTLWVRSRRRAGGAASWGDLRAEARFRRRLEKRWPMACEARGLRSRADGGAPRLRQLTPLGSESYRTSLRCGEAGIAVEDVQKAASALADIVGVSELDVARTEPGVATLTWHQRDPVGRVLPLADLPTAPKGRAAYGVRADGSAASIAYHLSVLFGGVTRSGKSNTGWVLLADLLRQGIPVRLHVSDIKGNELIQFREQVDVPSDLLDVRTYSNTVDGTVKMLTSAVGAMGKRSAVYAEEKRRKWTPSPRDPLTICWLDELVPLQAMLKKGSDSPFAQVAYTGGALGFAIWANAQAAHDEILGVARNFIPQRLCFSTTAPSVTDTVLGTGASARGARCHELVVPRDAGIGYSLSTEEGSRIERFRSALVTDAQTEYLARGELPPDMAAIDQTGEAPRRGLYRFFYRDDPSNAQPQYIGKSRDVLERLGQHIAEAREFTEGPVRVEIEWFHTQAELDAAEKRAIETEHPIWNDVWNRRNPDRRISRTLKSRRQRQAA